MILQVLFHLILDAQSQWVAHNKQIHLNTIQQWKIECVALMKGNFFFGNKGGYFLKKKFKNIFQFIPLSMDLDLFWQTPPWPRCPPSLAARAPLYCASTRAPSCCARPVWPTCHFRRPPTPRGVRPHRSATGHTVCRAATRHPSRHTRQQCEWSRRPVTRHWAQWPRASDQRQGEVSIWTKTSMRSMQVAELLFNQCTQRRWIL